MTTNKIKENIKLGLALGSGGARGLAHLGVLEAFQEEDINIDLITGSSMGSLIGGLYACGIPLKYIRGLAEELDWDHLSDVTFPRQGLIKGNKLLKFLEIMTKNINIEDLDLPFAAVACDIEKGERIILKKGSLAKAIRASTAIPGIYVPLDHQNRILVDGGVIDRVPGELAREMGADLVVAVDVGIEEINAPVKNIFDILLNTFDIMQLKYNKLNTINADILVKPELGDLSAFNLDCLKESIQAGKDAAKKITNQVKDLLEEKRNEGQ